MKTIFKFIIFACLIFWGQGFGYCASRETQSVVLNSNEDISPIFQFIDAIEKNNSDSIEALIKSGAGVDSNDKYGNTPLLYAVKNNNYKIAKLLIDNKADANFYSNSYSKILDIAISNQNVEISKLLVDNGAIVTSVDVINAVKSSNVSLLKSICKNSIKAQFSNPQTDNLDIAVENDNTEIIKILIAKGIEVNHRNDRKVSWLSSVCKFGFYDMAKVLVELGARMDLADDYGMTPIIWASWYGHAEIVRFLIDKGADVNSKTVDGTSALMFASCAGNVEVMKILIDKGAKIEAKNNNGINAFMEAVTSGQTDAMAFLKSKGADFKTAEEELSFIKNCGTNINKKDKFGATLLIVAVNEDNIEKVKLLIDRGAIVYYKIKADKPGYEQKTYENHTALYYAALNNNDAMVKLLIEKGARPDKIDEKNNPVLTIAASKKNYHLIKYLIDKKFNINGFYYGKSLRQYYETSPLVMALGNIKIMELLIKNGADIKQPVYGNCVGERTPFMLAVGVRDHLSANLLIKYGADTNYKITRDQVSCDNGSFCVYSPESAIESAIRDIVSIKSISPKITFTKGRNALREAVEIGDIEMIKLLQKMGADLNEKTEWGWTSLMLSIRSNNLETVKFLIESNIDVNAVSTEGLNWSAILEAATVCKNPKIINLLINKGANVNQIGIGGWTPLMLAVRSCNLEVVETLIKNGANVNAVNNDSMSPLDIAENIINVNPRIVRFLKNEGAVNKADIQTVQKVKNNAR